MSKYLKGGEFYLLDKNIAAGKSSYMSGTPVINSGIPKGPQYANDDQGASE